jgi:hypothetical protein
MLSSYRASFGHSNLQLHSMELCDTYQHGLSGGFHDVQRPDHECNIDQDATPTQAITKRWCLAFTSLEHLHLFDEYLHRIGSPLHPRWHPRYLLHSHLLRLQPAFHDPIRLYIIRQPGLDSAETRPEGRFTSFFLGSEPIYGPSAPRISAFTGRRIQVVVDKLQCTVAPGIEMKSRSRGTCALEDYYLV